MNLNMSFFLENGYPVINEEISENLIGDNFLTVINGELTRVTCDILIKGEPACILTFPHNNYKITLFYKNILSHSDFLKAIRETKMVYTMIR